MKGYTILGLLLCLFTLTYNLSTVQATVDPLSVPNNKFGIHIIQATPDESSPAAQMVNHNGDWGYITVLVESKDRNHNKWQEFFNDLRRRHLIPIVRLATQPLDSHWKRPYEGEEQTWADFLDSLNWPTKNRYVTVYNEPNHAKEWGNQVDAKNYAEILDQTITVLKSKNRDFFVLNGGFDASAPSKSPLYQDELIFLQQMEQAVPGIFSKLDGWVSHSYPNPNFSGSPNAVGRGTVRTWYWELQVLRSLGVTKDLPIFITETGWKHAEGLSFDPNLPSAETVSQYYQNAFSEVWNSNRIVAVTPFLLNYQEIPFDHFSFKKITGEKQKEKILGIEYPDYYPQYQAIKDLAKVSGSPIQDNLAQLIKGEVYSSIVAGESYRINITLKNIGQSIWNGSTSLTTSDQVRLVPISGGQELGIQALEIPKNVKVEPGQEFNFTIDLKAPQQGKFKVVLNLFSANTQFDSSPLEFTTEVKSPVVLKIKTLLTWKKNPSGDYILRISGAIGENSQLIKVKDMGESSEIEARYLLPNYAFDFILEKPYYLPKRMRQTVYEGINTLDFDSLQPDIISALLYPKQLWKLLPLSN